MIHFENIPFMESKTRNRSIYNLEKIKAEDVVPITENFDEQKIIGQAFNFRFEKDIAYCDIELEESCKADTIAPGFNATDVESEDGRLIINAAMLLYLDVINVEHSCESLTNNLKRAREKLIMEEVKK